MKKWFGAGRTADGSEETRGPRRGIVIAAVAALAVLGWGFFHPDFRADVGLVDASVRQALEKTGFKATQGITAARFKSVESLDGISEDWTSRQKIIPIDSLITEKRSRRRTRMAARETSGLYVGPFAVVRYTRDWPPLVGDLLPYAFWSSSRMSSSCSRKPSISRTAKAAASLRGSLLKVVMPAASSKGPNAAACDAMSRTSSTPLRSTRNCQDARRASNAGKKSRGLLL